MVEMLSFYRFRFDLDLLLQPITLATHFTKVEPEVTIWLNYVVAMV